MTASHADDTPKPSPPLRPTRSLCKMPQFGERGTILLLCYINLINYVDRGFVPGAPESFQAFTTKTLGIPASQQNLNFGILSSAFIAATALFSLIFGHLAHKYKPFNLIVYGMTAWLIAIVLSGVSYYVESYYLLLFGRAMSGVGEASFLCNGMPFINRHAPEKNRTLWLGIMIASITVGMASGFVYGSTFANSSLGWAWGFFVEAMLIIPAILCCQFCVPSRLNAVPTESNATEVELQESLLGLQSGPSTSSLHPHITHKEEQEQLVLAQGAPGAQEAQEDQEPALAHPTLRDWLHLYKNIPYALVIFGYASFTVTLTIFSIFSPILLIGVGFYDNEETASMVFGGIVLVCGTIGTISGAVALDKLTEAKGATTREQRCKLAIDLLFYIMTIGAIAGLVMILFTDKRLWFHIWFGISFLFMSAIMPAESVAVMESFPESRQAMAIAMNTVVFLIIGEVPSPVLLGYLKDTWAPRCGTIEIDGDAQLNPQCYLDRDGLHDVLLFSILWLTGAVALWGAAKFVLKASNRRKAPSVATIESPQHSQS